jgi:hypothetical protein
MDDMRQNRAGEAHHSTPLRSVASAAEGTGLGKILVVLLIVLSVLLIGGSVVKAFQSVSADQGVKGKQYQAVFLTNGQVYFGKVSSVDGSYVTLKDIYYLQVQQQVQPKDSKSTDTAQPQVSLAKLGGELHGPEDIMYISREQVLFWENLKNDGKVATAIKEYQASKK